MSKRKYLFIVGLVCISTFVSAQVQVPELPVNNMTEQQLEAVTEGNEDATTEDDSFLQSLRYFLVNPLNLNTAQPSELKELMVLTPLQIQNLVSYRKVFGKFLTIYELQAVPAWDVQTIQKIRPYVTVSTSVNPIEAFGKRFSGGLHTILARVVYTPEEAKGFKYDPAKGTTPYAGSRPRLFMRYKYTYKNLLQFGIVGDKDPGEEFFQGSQKQGFDFYSAHLFARNLGIVKALAIGDFTVNMGQGLTQWQSLAFKKSADAINVKRQLAVLRPYNSPAESDFHRGVGITLGKGDFEFTAFGTYHKLDANFNEGDTLNAEDDFVSSLQTSGYHRTESEIADKRKQTQIAFGGNFAYNVNRLHVGINAIQYKFDLPLYKSDEPYNAFALSGNNFGNYSIDYSYTFKNFHFFGEAAANNTFNKAFMNGILASVAPNVDMSLVYRNIDKEYQTLYTNAFTESTSPNNEKGFYAGISIRPSSTWRLDAYADFYKFSWLKYGVDAPSTGRDYLVQATYKPNKQMELYVRYRAETKAENYNPDESVMSSVVPRAKQNFRTQFICKINPQFAIRGRAEMVWYDKKGPAQSNGFLSFFDVLYKPLMKKYAGNLRVQYFETDNYDSRIYAYENDVLYSYTIPVFYDKGYRYYVNLNYDVNRRISVWFRWAQAIFPERTSIGSGLDEIEGNKKSEVKFQVLYMFR